MAQITDMDSSPLLARRLYFAAALVAIVTAVLVAVLLPKGAAESLPGICNRRPQLPQCQVARSADDRLPIRLGIIGVGLVAALALTARALSPWGGGPSGPASGSDPDPSPGSDRVTTRSGPDTGWADPTIEQPAVEPDTADPDAEATALEPKPSAPRSPSET